MKHERHEAHRASCRPPRVHTKSRLFHAAGLSRILRTRYDACATSARRFAPSLGARKWCGNGPGRRSSMRRRPTLTLIVGLALWSCGDPAGPPDGTLAVSTTTSGDDPDTDGFQLTIDGSDPLALFPGSTAELALSPGRHTLELVGVAAHCSVSPATSVEVDITAGSTTSVAFQISCPLTGVRITVTTTGQDLDPDGYRVMADSSDRGAIASNGTVVTKLDPGRRTIRLAGLASNCAIAGSAVYTFTIVIAQV